MGKLHHSISVVTAKDASVIIQGRKNLPEAGQKTNEPLRGTGCGYLQQLFLGNKILRTMFHTFRHMRMPV
jgi:hypothetical protein